jgi:hypothetical protein
MMRKLLLVCVTAVFSFSCVTNPVTEDSFEPHAPPPADIYLIPTVFVPGLPQLLHGEYLEGIVYILGSIGSAALVIPHSRMENEAVYPSGDGADSFYFFSALSAGFYALGVIDAVATSVIRNADWQRINRSRMEQGYPFTERLKRVRPGVSAAELVSLLGRPAVREEFVGFDSSRRERWLYYQLSEKIVLILAEGRLEAIDTPEMVDIPYEEKQQ